MNMLARWLFRRIVKPRIMGVLVNDKVTGARYVFKPDEMTVVFRGR